MDRKLTTIFASDVVGFSKMMGEDEVKTLNILKERREAIDSIIEDHGGVIFGSAGDSVIAEFASPIKAAEAAVATQQKMKTMNVDMSESDQMTFRVGINIGDVMIEENNLFGDAVNIAARLEAAARPSGICVSKTVFDMINRKILVSFEDAGELELKNIELPIKAFHVLENTGIARFTQDSEKIQTEVKEAEPGSVAVMYFKNLSNDEEQEYFCEGFSEDLLSMLSRYNKLVVISSHASFSYKNKSKSSKEIGGELGVRYIINGSVRKLGPKMRINVKLISTENESTIWSNNYDLSVDEVFDVQDQIAEEIVSTTVGRVEEDSLKALKVKQPENKSAYELVLQGLEYAKKGNVLKENTKLAAKLFEKAIEADPNYARAHAWHACTLGNLMEWEEDESPELMEKCFNSLTRAMEIDPNEPEVNRIMGAVKFYFEKDYDLGLHHFKKARELCPSDVFIATRYALALIYCGEFQEALSELERAKRLDPFSNDLLYGPLAFCHYWMGDNDKAIECFKTIKVLNAHLFYLAATYAKKGESELAKEKLKEARAINDQDIEQFLASQSYSKEELTNELRKTLESISN